MVVVCCPDIHGHQSKSTGHDVASVRDQAKRTGDSKDKVQRSLKRGMLGSILDKVRGTSLDKGVELDALGKLPEAEQEALANRAASGEEVSARTPDRKPTPEPAGKPQGTSWQKALVDFVCWIERNGNLDHLASVQRRLQACQIDKPAERLPDAGGGRARRLAPDEQQHAASGLGLKQTGQGGSADEAGCPREQNGRCGHGWNLSLV